MMIFALSVIGCAVFATCVVGLFFWQKSLRPLTFQNPLQLGPKHQLGIIDVVSDADAQYPLPFKAQFSGGAFWLPGPDRYWGYSITLPSRFQIKLDIKSAVYDITAAWSPTWYSFCQK